MKEITSLMRLTKQIQTAHRKYKRKSMIPIGCQIALGHLLNNCKRIAEREKLLWGKYAAKNFPEISIRKRQRIMKVARSVDQRHSSSLHLLEITNLYNLSTLCGKDGIETFLNENKISLNFQRTNKSVQLFQVKVIQLITKHKTQNSPSQKSKVPKQFSSWLADLDDKAKTEKFNLSEKQLTSAKNWIKTLSGIVATVENK